MDTAQRKLLRSRLRVAITAQPEIGHVRALLLNIGGIELVAPPWADHDAPMLIHAGFLMSWPVRLRKMERSACHQNVARLWGRDRGGLTAIGTGYALSEGGLWRQHSWGIERRGIVETTQIRKMYFGLMLEGTDADLFALANGKKA